MIVTNWHDYIAGGRIKRNIDTGIFQGIDDARLLGIGKRRIECSAFRLLRDNEEDHADDRHNNADSGRQHLAQALPASQAVDNCHRPRSRDSCHTSGNVIALTISRRIHHCRCFCHRFVSRIWYALQCKMPGHLDRHVHDVFVGAEYLVTNIQGQLETK